MNYAFDQDSGRFFCMPHFGLHSLVKYKYQRKPEQPTDTPDKGVSRRKLPEPPNLTKCRECAFTAFGNIQNYSAFTYSFVQATFIIIYAIKIIGQD